MTVSSRTQAVLLLTAHFSKPKAGDVKPLAAKEWGRFALWIDGRSLKPEALLSGDTAELLAGWQDGSITLARLERLMNRGSALALAMDKWLRAGLWVMTRSDDDYPDCLRDRLKAAAPAVLFGCGNPKLLSQGGIAVVGSRNADEPDLAFSRGLGLRAAGEGYSIVSGGARGIDEAAMMGALEAEGTVIGVLADNLLRATSSAKYRKHLMSNNLVLVSHVYPEARFSVGNAMARNKYIYCLSDAGVVVHSGTKGGTWSGAFENLRQGWVPLWVKETRAADAGNEQIVGKGAAWLSSSLESVKLDSLFAEPRPAKDEAADRAAQVRDAPDQPLAPRESSVEIGFYDLFLLKIRGLCQGQARKVDELVAALDVRKSQLDVWLKRAVSEQKLKKLSRPVRYQWLESHSEQMSMFGE